MKNEKEDDEKTGKISGKIIFLNRNGVMENMHKNRNIRKERTMIEHINEQKSYCILWDSGI